MASRLVPRLSIVGRALVRRATGGRRRRPASPRRILVAHHLLLGDTLMLTPLLAKLAAQYPDAERVMTMARPVVPLYSARPYGVRALGWNPRDADSVRALIDEGPFDLALIPGDNRHSWLAQAMGARWIVAFAGDRPRYKDWPVDELRRYSATPAAWFDMAATLVDGPAPPPFQCEDWPEPPCAPFARPDREYCVLHVGASSRLKLWPAERWRALAAALRARGLAIVWSGGPGEAPLVDACEPRPEDRVTAGSLDLAQLWHLLSRARLLVAPDTGVAHVGRIACTPTIVLFGPGSPVVTGYGEFWRDDGFAAVTVDPFPCRDQRLLFKREIEWVRVCRRAFGECTEPACMHALDVTAVIGACDKMLVDPRHSTYPAKMGHRWSIAPV